MELTASESSSDDVSLSEPLPLLLPPPPCFSLRRVFVRSSVEAESVSDPSDEANPLDPLERLEGVVFGPHTER